MYTDREVAQAILDVCKRHPVIEGNVLNLIEKRIAAARKRYAIALLSKSIASPSLPPTPK